MTSTALEVRLASRPSGWPTDENFEIAEVEVPTPGDGEILVRNVVMSVDPYMRGRMNDVKSYVPPFQVGAPLDGGAVGEVVTSNSPDFKPGDHVLHGLGWRDYAVVNAAHAVKVDGDLAPLSTYLGVLGMPGLTAYAGLLKLGQPRAGETVVVGAATGPVGSVVGQLARIHGARAVGVAGGPEKCRALVEELGFDAAVDRTAPGFASALAAACPRGVDVYFENVGGELLRAVLPLLNDFARIPLCGLVSNYSGSAKPTDPDRSAELLTTLLVKRVTLRGFVVSDFAAEEPAFRREMTEWLEAGRLRYREDLVDGLDAAPAALIGLLQGRNFGKVVVQVAPEDQAT